MINHGGHGGHGGHRERLRELAQVSGRLVSEAIWLRGSQNIKTL